MRRDALALARLRADLADIMGRHGHELTVAACARVRHVLSDLDAHLCRAELADADDEWCPCPACAGMDDRGEGDV